MPVTVYFSSKSFEKVMALRRKKVSFKITFTSVAFTMWKVGYKKQTAVSLRRPLCIFYHEGKLYNGIAITFFIPATTSYAIFFFYCYLFWSLLIIRVITWSWHTFANQHFSSKIFPWISMFYNDYSCIERFFSLIPIEPNAQRDRIIILCKRETRTKFAWISKVSKISK